MSNFTPQAINDGTFKNDVIKAKGPVLVDFWADWCGPCRAIAPVLDDLAQEYGEQLSIKKIDADANPEAIAQFGVRSIPTLILFKDGEAIETLTGLNGKKTIKATVDPYIN